MKVRRVIATRRTIVFHPIKISGLSVEATLRWMRNVPGSFWDFPAPRSAVHCRHGLTEVLASTNHPIRFSPLVDASCRPPKSKINLLHLQEKQRVRYHKPHPDAREKLREKSSVVSRLSFVVSCPPSLTRPTSSTRPTALSHKAILRSTILLCAMRPQCNKPVP